MRIDSWHVSCRRARTKPESQTPDRKNFKDAFSREARDSERRKMTAAGNRHWKNDSAKKETRKKKGPLALASGPSLGRKRPRRAAIARGATAPQQYATALHKSARAFASFPVQNSLRPAIGQKFNADVFLTLFQILGDRPVNSIGCNAAPLSPGSRIRDRRGRQKMHRFASKFATRFEAEKCRVLTAISVRYPCATCRIGLGRNSIFSPRSEPKEQP